MKKLNFQKPMIETNSVEVLSNKLIAITNELTKTNEKLEQTQRERNDMISNISHDLRAPISAIRSAIDLLLSGQILSEHDIHDALHLIDRRTDTLQALIQDMHLLFTLESNDIPLHFDKIKAVPFFEEYFYNVLIDNRYNDKQMHLDISENMNLYINIDIQKMLCVLDNLMINAAKYSNSGADITLSVQPDKSISNLVIRVIDTGIGIPSDCIAKIFERTYTVSSARTPETCTGSGLGLCIAKSIVEKLKGNIICESEVNQGSTFTVVLPLATTP